VLCPQVKSIRDGVALGQKIHRKERQTLPLLCAFAAIVANLHRVAVANMAHSGYSPTLGNAHALYWLANYSG